MATTQLLERRRTPALLRRVALLGAVSLGALGLTVPAAQATPAPTPTDLGTLGGRGSRALAVSGDIVVGWASTAGEVNQAFAYDLGAAAPTMQSLGDIYSEATAVSGNIVVGWANAGGETVHAFAYDLGAAPPTMVDLGTLGGPESQALAVSGNVVVGWARTTPGQTHAFAYDLGAAPPTMVDLGTLGGSNSEAVAVHGNIVVGWSRVAGDTVDHAFAYDLGALSPTMVDLGALGGTYSYARAVSGNIVVGYSAIAGDAAVHAFAYDLGALPPTMVDLGTLGGTYTEAVAVDGNVVIGTSNLTGDAVNHAFSYDLSAAPPTMVDLGTLGGTNSQALAVSGDVVAGTADITGDADSHAFAYDLGAAPPTMQDLGTLGGPDSHAVAVSGDVVVGRSWQAGDEQAHAAAWDLTPAAGSTFEVNSTNDVDDSVCDATHCSLREAINAANAGAVADTISFEIPTAPFTIQPATQLPTITNPVTIDGRTQTGYAGTPIVELDGQNTAVTSVGLLITADDVTVQGLVVNRFAVRGILFDGADRGIVRGNYVTTDVTGDNDLGRMGWAGLSLTNSSDALVGGTVAADRNVLGGAYGLEITGAGATANLVIGNHLGVKASGQARLGVRAGGLMINGGSSANTIGGDTAAERNVGYGFHISGAATHDNIVIGNHIGTNPAGTAGLCPTCGNVGINDGHHNRIGGSAPGEGNLISGGSGGVGVGGAGATGNIIQGNRIGTDITGTAVIGVGSAAPGIGVGSPNTVVGGALPGEGNIIVGASDGISIVNTPSGTTVRGNHIGTDATGTLSLPNVHHGVLVSGGTGVTIGGSGPGEGNVIAFNNQAGVSLPTPFSGTPASGISILGNSIHSNGWLGIDLGQTSSNTGVTPNDAADVDTGVNGFQNFPVVDSVNTTGNTVRVAGSLDSATGAYRVDLYANSTCDASGHGEAERYLGAATVNLPAPGSTQFEILVRARVPVGAVVTATATSAAGSTSEIAACDPAVNLATVANFDGDGDTEASVWRPSTGAWYQPGGDPLWWGLPSDIPVAADYDGDGTTDQAVYRDGAWYVFGQPTVFFGLAGDVPVPGDYDGDGDTDRAVYRAGAWHVEGQATVYHGLTGDIPVPADYDGDGDTDRAIFRDGAWYVDGQSPAFFGLAGDIPVPGDYDGDGDADRAVYRGGVWYVDGQPSVFLGISGDVPVPADYDGDATIDQAIFRDGEWHIDGLPTEFLGAAGDYPVPLPQAIYRAFFAA